MTDLKKLAAECLAKLKEAGADAAQARPSVSEHREFNIDGGEFSLYRTVFSRSLTLTAFRETKTGSVTLNSFEPADIDRAVSDCMASVDSDKPDPARGIAENQGERELTYGVPEPDAERFFARTKELKEEIEKRYPSIIMEQMICDHGKTESVYADTNGNLFHMVYGAYGVGLMFSAHRDGKASSFMGAGYQTADLDAPLIEQGDIARALADVEKQIDTVPVEGNFTGTVVLAPDCLGDLLRCAIGSFASGTPLIDGTSVWRDKLGKEVASPDFTLSLAPHDPAVVLPQQLTSDGYLTEDFDLIKNGVLESFVAGVYVSNKVGCPRSKNTATGWLAMPAGDKTLDELIAGIDDGLFVYRFSGGRPANNGDFSGVAKNSFRIKDGKIADAVSETMISGNLADMLFHFAGASSERVSDGSSSLPFAAFSGVTISGK
ncbi:MAG: TldD/PmbA family protein [Clostridia bacterium]|nr:TldD/PmbA family protein [Clostridia bacterium]